MRRQAQYVYMIVIVVLALAASAASAQEYMFNAPGAGVYVGPGGVSVWAGVRHGPSTQIVAPRFPGAFVPSPRWGCNSYDGYRDYQQRLTWNNLSRYNRSYEDDRSGFAARRGYDGDYLSQYNGPADASTPGGRLINYMVNHPLVPLGIDRDPPGRGYNPQPMPTNYAPPVIVERQPVYTPPPGRGPSFEQMVRDPRTNEVFGVQMHAGDRIVMDGNVIYLVDPNGGRMVVRTF